MNLTDEFLEDLVELAEAVGWGLDLTEVIDFIYQAYGLAEKEMPEHIRDRLTNIRG